MNARDHGSGVFFWDVYGGHEYLSHAMIEDCKEINKNNSFYRFVAKYNDGNLSRDECLAWFHSIWRFIPEDMLLETYEDLLADSDWARGSWAYKYFF